MSKVTVKFNEKKRQDIYGEHDGVPIFYSFESNKEDIYALVKDITNKEYPYKVVSLVNGHLQRCSEYKNIDEFLDKHNKNIVFLNLSVEATEI